MDEQFKQVMNGEEIEVFAHQCIKTGSLYVHDSDTFYEAVCIAKGKVVFSPVDSDKAIQEASEMLDQKIQDTYAKAEIEVSRIKDQKAALLSLTHSK